MTEQEKGFINNAAKIIVTFGGVLTCLWIIYYLYDLLWK
jgi:hypothetical protein